MKVIFSLLGALGLSAAAVWLYGYFFQTGACPTGQSGQYACTNNEFAIAEALAWPLAVALGLVLLPCLFIGGWLMFRQTPSGNMALGWVAGMIVGWTGLTVAVYLGLQLWLGSKLALERALTIHPAFFWVEWGVSIGWAFCLVTLIGGTVWLSQEVRRP